MTFKVNRYVVILSILSVIQNYSNKCLNINQFKQTKKDDFSVCVVQKRREFGDCIYCCCC